MKGLIRFAEAAFVVLVALLGLQPPAAHAQQWQLLDGRARDVGVGADGSVWVIGTAAVPGGYEIYRRGPSGWINVPGGAERIAVDPRGNAWVVNNSQTIFRYDGSKWVVVNGQARDVGIGANGTVWVIGNNPEGNDYGIYRTTDNGANWTKIPGAAVRIAVDPTGNAWVVNSNRAIFRYDGTKWIQTPGAAKDVGVGADGAVWVIGTDSGIYRWDGSNWAKKTGGAEQISGGPGGVVWVVNAGGEIYKAQDQPQAPTAITLTQPAPISIALPTNVVIPPSGGGSVTSGSLVTGAAPVVPGTIGTAPLVVTGYTQPVKSGPECGGMVNGQAQPRCAPARATKIGASRNSCSSGTFFDLTTWSCWSCPSGYDRSAAPVISEQACSKTDSSVGLTRVSATLIGPRCPSGSFFDPIRGGECWKCPDDDGSGPWLRSASSIDNSDACWRVPKERTGSATRVKNTAWAWDCGGGTFWDGYDGGACWKCPDDLPRRTAAAVWAGNACATTIIANQTHAATFLRKGECEAGTIFDPRNGGECWKCPAGDLRTIYPVNESSACEHPAGVQFASATKSAPLTCNPDEIFDPIQGGSCWKCPDGYDRTASSVEAWDACKTDRMIWKTVLYTEPGMFRLDGAADVLLEVTRTNPALVRDTLDKVAAKLSTQNGTPLAQVRAEQQSLFVNTPQDSLVAQGVVLARLIAAATDPTRASAAETRLVQSFSAYVIAKRTYIAEDMLAAYDNWYASDQYWRAQMHLTQGLAGAMYYGTVPPSFDKLGMAATVGIYTTSTATSLAIDASVEALEFAKAAQRLNILGDVLGAVLTQAGNGWKSNSSTELIALSATRSVGEIAVSQAIGQLLTTMAQVPAGMAFGVAAGVAMPAAVLSAVGPQLIVAGGMMLASMAIDQFVQITEARPKLEHAITTAKADPDLSRMVKLKEGVAEVETHWSYLTGGVRIPDQSFTAAYTPVAQAALTTATAVAAPRPTPTPVPARPGMRRPGPAD